VKKLLLSTVALVGLTVAAGAADLPRRSVAPAPIVAVPVFTWTGFYVGVNAGYSFNADSRATTVGTPGFLTLIPGGIVPSELETGGDGFIGGGQIGFNLQFGAFVAGIEADLQYVDSGQRTSFIGAPVLGTQLNTSAEAEIEYLGTVRGRLGVAFDRLLVYATGGLAYGDVSLGASVNGVQAPVLSWNGSTSDVQVGYAVGGGVEYAFTNNLTLKAEYLYYDLGDQTVRTVPNAAVLGVAALNGIAYDTRIETNGHIARVGLNYKF
jgi:outer membrane immunogenic protein